MFALRVQKFQQCTGEAIGALFTAVKKQITLLCLVGIIFLTSTFEQNKYYLSTALSLIKNIDVTLYSIKLKLFYHEQDNGRHIIKPGVFEAALDMMVTEQDNTSLCTV